MALEDAIRDMVEDHWLFEFDEAGGDEAVLTLLRDMLDLIDDLTAEVRALVGSSPGQ